MRTRIVDFFGTRAGAVTALLIGACAIGFAPIFVRLTETGPAAAGFWRLALALPALALLAGRFAREDAAEGGGGNRLLVLAGLLFAADLAFWHYGIAFTSVANATVLANMTPVVVTIGAWLLFREKPTRTFLAALVLALSGSVCLAMAKSGGERALLGDVLSALTAVWYGAYFLTVKEARRRGLSASRVMLGSSLIGAPALLLFALAMGETVLPGSWAGWGACLGLALVHVTGQGLIAWALGRLPPATASVTILVQPVVAAALGWALFAEAVVALQFLGAALVLGGVTTAQLSARRA